MSNRTEQQLEKQVAEAFRRYYREEALQDFAEILEQAKRSDISQEIQAGLYSVAENREHNRKETTDERNHH